MDEEEPRNPIKGERVLAHTRKKGPFCASLRVTQQGGQGTLGRGTGGQKVKKRGGDESTNTTGCEGGGGRGGNYKK